MGKRNKNVMALEDRKQVQEWGRHFDTLFWHVTAFFVAALGGLLAFVYSSGNETQIIIELIGLSLTFLAVYFASSFRQIRNNFQREYPKEIKKLFNNRGLWQGIFYYGFFWLIGVVWIYRSLDAINFLPPIFLCIFIWECLALKLYSKTKFNYK